MKTRQKHPGVPEPQSPWNEIRPRLWMGGHFWADAEGGLRPAVVDAQFDLVVSLFTRDGHGPHPRVDHLVHEIPDGPLTSTQIRSVQQAATTVAAAVRSERTVLVRCRSGYNRSGLVVGQALVELGHDAAGAVDLIRQNRSPWALHNRTFEQYLTTGLEVACLLVGLDAGS
ncbi:dual specificity protein phosphatase family protein [Streptacidiphilus anmyonensis]|uniref:dual specificity protein phosphatase family protein n=1 Tax=Streptacidiphilus anmyonensis TaxID=405782 RepID=UPI0005A9646A|nr:dual specificity protein phosphatase family protein [Streptacidiphilus anmyonensis]